MSAPVAQQIITSMRIIMGLDGTNEGKMQNIFSLFFFVLLLCGNVCHQMSDFKAKVHQICFPLGLRPRPRWGSLQRSPVPSQTPWLYLRSLLLSGGGKEREWEGERKER